MVPRISTAILFARYFATTEHVTKRGHTHSGLPYTHHLMTVEGVLRRFLPMETESLWEWIEPLLVAAWLHDVVEDCPEVKIKHIRELFGERVADLVWAVTKDPGPRKMANLANYEQIRNTCDAILLKLADRIGNVEAGGPLVEMYRKEHTSFQHGLAGAETRLGPVAKAMWEHLDTLFTPTPHP